MVVTRMNAHQKQSHAAAVGGYRDYGFSHVGPSHMHPRFLPHVFALAGEIGRHTRVLDVGCGNGYTVGQFLARGCEATGIDLSETGIAIARATYPKGRFEIMCAAGNLSDQLSVEPFDLVVSTEVVEHLYDPRAYAVACFAALRPGGRFICTTPYHGYLKNLLLSVLAKWDSHADPLWDGGHIKLWSRKTLSRLLLETGFRNLQFRGAGRFPGLWMTMVVSADKPAMNHDRRSHAAHRDL
ncbi:MAG: methyltransferase [Acidobacteria bacterium]|nr:MAG: methyltransferase [Acidobacteriota bacterium]